MWPLMHGRCAYERGCRRRHKACILKGNVVRHEGAEGKRGCRRHKTCMSQGDVPRHEGVEGIVTREYVEGHGVPKVPSLHVAGRCA
ncbi:unnamed protein product [Prunus armeniaca]